jgi:hypothetical protein
MARFGGHMRGRAAGAVVATSVVTVLLVALAAGSAWAAAGRSVASPSPCVATATTQLREAGRYLVTLAVGPVPRMYTVAQARALKPTSGVVMLEPMHAVAGGGMMEQGGGRRHIRVQVCDRATGKALASPRPVVELTQAMLRERFTLTRGYDVGTPPSQIRFCQVAVLPGGQLGLAVLVGTQSATFSATA